MISKKTFLTLLLSLLLLGAQQMGWMHALSHVIDGKSASGLAKQAPGDKACEQCLAFAQIGAALHTSPTVFADASTADVRATAARPQVARAIAFRAFRSRAPPFIL